jgi:hypothetical protein
VAGIWKRASAGGVGAAGWAATVKASKTEAARKEMRCFTREHMLAERAKRSKPAQGPEPENWSGTSID